MVLVTWNQCQGNVWCSLARVRLSSVTNSSGVYIIWKREGLLGKTVVYVGQGYIR